MKQFLLTSSAIALLLAVAACNQDEAETSAEPAAPVEEQMSEAPAEPVEPAPEPAPATEPETQTGDAVQQLQDSARSAGEAVRDLAGQAGEEAGEQLRQLGEQAETAGEQLRQRAEEAVGETGGQLEEGLQRLGESAQGLAAGAMQSGSQAAREAGEMLDGAARSLQEAAEEQTEEAQTAMSADDSALAGTEWRFDGIEGATLAFADGQVSGNTGCNGFSGSYTVNGDALELSPLAMTKMACPGEAADNEARVVAALDATTGYSVDGDSLVLRDANGEPTITLEPVAMQ